MDTENKIPVTILTGFLGAGKTTLLNNIIKKYPQKKFAVIENEFGQEGIDGGLIIGDVSKIIELSNGCICCNLSDDLQKVLDNLLSSKYTFNHLIIETTGIADPAGVIDSFVAYQEFRDKFVMDSVICLADAQTYEDSALEQPEVHRQLAVSDIVLLNKIEDVTPEYGEKIKSILKSVNPNAKLYCVSHAKIDNIDIIDTFYYTAQNIEKTVMDFKNLSPMKISAVNQSPSFAVKPENASKLKHDIVSEGFTIYGDLNEEKFVRWIQAVLQYNSATIFRIKGILSIKNNPQKLIFQSVREFFLVEGSSLWAQDEQRFTKLIFIGKKINREAIEGYLKSFIEQ